MTVTAAPRSRPALAPAATAPTRGTASTLVTGARYAAELATALDDAHERVRLTTLTVGSDGPAAPVIDALVRAARRGVDVRVSADVFTYVDTAASTLGAPMPSSRRRRARALHARLTEAGAHMRWLGRETGLPFRGRTHTKLTVVDDVAWSFGGVNMDGPGVSHVDYMIRTADAGVADALTRLHDGIARENPRERMASHAVAHPHGRMLVDGGAPGDSIIYRTALALAVRATRVVHVSQYCPTGPLGVALATRADGLWFNPPQRASFANGALIGASMAWTGHRTRYRRPTYLHAKALVFAFADGARAAISGSHNFVTAGVRLGTREIALETHDDHVIDQILAFHHAEVAQAAR